MDLHPPALLLLEARLAGSVGGLGDGIELVGVGKFGDEEEDVVVVIGGCAPVLCGHVVEVNQVVRRRYIAIGRETMK